MQKITFPYSTSNITLYIAATLEEQYLTKLEKDGNALISAIDDILNYRKPDSAAAQFNNLDLNFPFAPISLFWQYLELNLYYCQKFPESFKVLTSQNKRLDCSQVDEYMTLDQEEQTVVKKQEVQFSSTLLLTAFLLKQLADLITEKKVNSFLLGAHNLFLAAGTETWEVAFEHPLTAENLELTVCNEAVALELQQIPTEKKEISGSPFSGKSAPYFAAIVEAADPVLAKVVGKQALSLSSSGQFQTLARGNKCGITMLDAANHVFQYSA